MRTATSRQFADETGVAAVYDRRGYDAEKRAGLLGKARLHREQAGRQGADVSTANVIREYPTSDRGAVARDVNTKL